MEKSTTGIWGNKTIAQKKILYVKDAKTGKHKPLSEQEIKSVDNNKATMTYTLRIDEILTRPCDKDESRCKNKINTDTIYKLEPGQFAVISTLESINLPPNTLGIVFPKNTLSSKGLLFVNPGIIVPGQSNQNAFTVLNISQKDLELEHDEPIARIVFFETDPSQIFDYEKQNYNVDSLLDRLSDERENKKDVIEKDAKKFLPVDFASLNKKSDLISRNTFNRAFGLTFIVTFGIAALTMILPPVLDIFLKNINKRADIEQKIAVLKVQLAVEHEKTTKLEQALEELKIDNIYPKNKFTTKDINITK